MQARFSLKGSLRFYHRSEGGGNGVRGIYRATALLKAAVEHHP